MTSKRIVLVGNDEETGRFFARRMKDHALEVLPSLADVDLATPPDLVVYSPADEISEEDTRLLKSLSAAALPFMVVSAVETMKAAVLAIKTGAADYFLRSEDRETLGDAVIQALYPPKTVAADPSDDDDPELDDFMIGRSAKIQEVFKLIGKIAQSTVSVLLRGESGTGKELVARQIHRNSPRRAHPFVCIDCAAIPRELVENELFGHEAGAYSGAEGRATGKFDVANHGTVFLDEVSEMDLELQAKVLRVIQENVFDRVGGSRPVRVDVRILVATQADLEKQVKAGRFRADLYHRLNVITLYLPPLRERREDIPVLARHFVRKHCRSLAIPEKQLAVDFMRSLESYDWPGNVRELENLIRRGILMERGPVVSGRFLELTPGAGDGPVAAGTLAVSRVWTDRFLVEEINWRRADVHRQMTDKVERLLLKIVLKQTRGNQVTASRILGVSRNTLRVKMKELGLLSSAFK